MDRQGQPRIYKTALTAWLAVSALIAFTSLALYLVKGADAFSLVITDPPQSNLNITLLSTLIIWLLAGSFISLLHYKVINSSNLILWAGFFFVAVIYVNLLRERIRYGDLDYYVQAALALSKGEPLPTTYVYPLLWAGVLAIFAPLGENGIFLFAWILNIIALCGFYFLIVKSLEVYGFAQNLASLITVVFILLNVPLLRTMVYGQVNLIVMDGILLALVLYRRASFLSALALTVAVQIKISPIVLILAILLERDWKWLAWFTLNMLIVAAIPILVYGLAPYNDILHSLSLMSARTSFLFRDTSFDSFLFSTFNFLKVDYALTRILIYASKLTLVLLALRAAFANARTSTFFADNNSGKYFYNSAPVLLLLMTVISPLVWEHHGIFLALSFLVLLRTLSTEMDWFIFLAAYFFEFAVPSFDFYPWSYVRLLAPLMVLWLLWKSKSETSFFTRANDWAVRLSSAR